MKYRMADGGRPAPVKTALVLSGGGAKGAYQVGVIRELLNRGIKPDLVTGSSIGAFNGVFLAEFINRGCSGKAVSKKIEQVWMEVGNFLKLNWGGFFRNILSPLAVPSIYTNRPIRHLLSKHIPAERSFSEYTSCQLSVTGTNLNRQAKKIFDFNSQTAVIEAVLASMAYPVAFPSVKVDGDFYIDGGALDNAPLKEAILWGAEYIIVVFLTPLAAIKGGGGEKDGEDYSSALKVIEGLIDLAANRMMYGDLEKAERINQLISLLSLYEEKLPEDFTRKLKKVYGLKPEGGKRLVKIIKIAPDDFLKPPGTMGFNQQEVLRKLIFRGEADARRIISEQEKKEPEIKLVER